MPPDRRALGFGTKRTVAWILKTLIWLGENRYGFDLIEAVHVLSDRKILSDWLKKPFFP